MGCVIAYKYSSLESCRLEIEQHWGIRPEHLRLDRNNPSVNGEVLVVERLGGQTYLYVKIEGGDIVVVQNRRR